MKSRPTLRQLLFRPVIFVTITLGILVIAELVAIGQLTWLNNQRLHTIEKDISEDRELEANIFELLQLQLKLAATQNTSEADKTHISDIENQLLEVLETHTQHNPQSAESLRNLKEVFSKALAGDQKQLTTVFELIRQVLD